MAYTVDEALGVVGGGPICRVPLPRGQVVAMPIDLCKEVTRLAGDRREGSRRLVG